MYSKGEQGYLEKKINFNLPLSRGGLSTDLVAQIPATKRKEEDIIV